MSDALSPSLLCLLTGRAVTKLFEDAVAEAPAEPAAPVYKASPALPFLEYPPNLEGYAGDVGFDPFRFSDFLPVDFLREAELKHSRMCMLAVVGWVTVDSGVRIYPTPEAYDGLTVLTAHDALVKSGAMGQILLWIGISETFSTIATMQMLEGSGRQPGDYGFDPVGFLKGATPEKEAEMQLKELTVRRMLDVVLSDIYFPR
jgi:light-harvesting complex I chlorophyll a/b binding protein 1